MAGNRFVYEVAVDTASLNGAAEAVRRTLGGAMSPITGAGAPGVGATGAGGLAGMTAGVGGLRAAMAGLLPVMGAFGVTLGASALVGFAQDAIMTASAVEESTNKMRVVFGGASADIEKFAQNAAKNLGMSRQAATEAVGTFGNLFTSMGLSQRKASEMSRGLVQLATDLGSFNNIDPGLALEKLRAGMVGEAEPLRTLGINITAAATKMKALELGLIGAGDELDTQTAVMARYALAMEQSKNAQGDFARTSDGLANSLRIAAAEVEDLKANLGKLVEKPWTAVVHVTSEIVADINSVLESTPEQRAAIKRAADLKLAQQRLAEAEAGLRKSSETGEYLSTTTAAWRRQVDIARAGVSDATIAMATFKAATDPAAASMLQLGDNAAYVKAQLTGATDTTGIAEEETRNLVAALDELRGKDEAAKLNTVAMAIFKGEISQATVEALGLAAALEQVQRNRALEAGDWIGPSRLEADRAAGERRKEEIRTATAAAKEMKQALEAGGRSIKAEIESAFGSGSNFSKALGDLTGGGPLAPGQGGPFEDIYRLQAWLKDNSWSETASKFGFGEGDKDKVAAIIKDFQNRNYTPDVQRLIDQAKLPGAAGAGLTGVAAPTLLADVQAQFATPESTAALAGVGSLMVKEIFAAWETDASTTPWAGSLIAQIQLSLIAYFEAQQKGQRQ